MNHLAHGQEELKPRVCRIPRPMQAWSLALAVGPLLATRTSAWQQRGPNLKHIKTHNTPNLGRFEQILELRFERFVSFQQLLFRWFVGAGKACFSLSLFWEGFAHDCTFFLLKACECLPLRKQ